MKVLNWIYISNIYLPKLGYECWTANKICIPALSNCDNISELDVSEAWRKMNRHVFVPLLKSVIFLDVVEVISPHHDGSVHLHLGNDSSQDTSTDWDLTKIYVSILSAFFANIFQNPHPGCQIIGWKMNGQVH